MGKREQPKIVIGPIYANKTTRALFPGWKINFQDLKFWLHVDVLSTKRRFYLKLSFRVRSTVPLWGKNFNLFKLLSAFPNAFPIRSKKFPCKAVKRSPRSLTSVGFEQAVLNDQFNTRFEKLYVTSLEYKLLQSPGDTYLWQQHAGSPFPPPSHP